MTSTSVDRIYGLSSSAAIKAPVRVASTAAITLSGLQTVDGVVLVAGDRVLVKDQANQTTNGIYVAATSTWQRDQDFDGARDVAKGTIFRINEGTTWAGFFFALTTSGEIVFGTSALSFATTGGPGTISAAMLPVVSAATLLAGREALGVAIPVECSVTGTANALVLTPVHPGPLTLTDGLELSFTPTATATSAATVTINYNGTGGKQLYAPSNQWFALTNDVIKGAPTTVRYDAANARFVLKSAPLSWSEGVSKHGQITFGPTGATTVACSAQDGSGFLIWDTASQAFQMCHISAGGVPGGNLLDCTVDGVSGQALSPGQLYHVYLFDSTNPTLEFSMTGPAVNWLGIDIKTGDQTRTYVGAVYTINYGSGIDVAFKAAGSGQLSAVCYSHYNPFFLPLQSDAISASTASSTGAELSASLRMNVVMEAMAFQARYTGFVTSATSGVTVTLEAVRNPGGVVIQATEVTIPSANAKVPILAEYSQALDTGYYQFIAQGSVSGGATATFKLCASLLRMG